jgi:hypothetical protein
MVVIDAGAHSEHVQAIGSCFKPANYSSLVIARPLCMRCLFIINIISVLIALQLNKVLVDAAVSPEHGKIIKCNFTPGSVYRSVDLDGVIHLSSSGSYLNPRKPIKIGNFDCLGLFMQVILLATAI